MSSRARLGAVVLSLAGAATFLGCALVIDLGDEVSLRPSEAGVDATPAKDAGPVEAGPADKCGLRQSESVTCRNCIEDRCCDISKQCAAEPACANGLECIKDCMGQITCLVTCLVDEKGDRIVSLANLTDCSSLNCSSCTPGPECTKLGRCGRTFPDAGADAILTRNIARTGVLQLDEGNCTTLLNQARQVSTNPDCTNP